MFNMILPAHSDPFREPYWMSRASLRETSQERGPQAGKVLKRVSDPNLKDNHRDGMKNTLLQTADNPRHTCPPR